MVEEPLCKFESLYNRYLRSNIHNITNAFKAMEPKFWCWRHTKFDIKDVMICEKHSHMVIGWWTLFFLLPQSHINICEEIDGNSATRESTLIKICSKLLDANLSQGRISPLNSLHLCRSSEHLGRWLWSEVERKDPSGPSRMVHYVYHNLGWLKFCMLPAQNFIQ